MQFIYITHSIQYFVENGIPKLEKNQKSFMENPSNLGEWIKEVKRILMEFGCQIVSEMLEECNTMLEESGKCRRNWQMKDREKKSLLTGVGHERRGNRKENQELPGKRRMKKTGRMDKQEK